MGVGRGEANRARCASTHSTLRLFHTYAQRPQREIPHLRKCPYKEGVGIAQNQIPLHVVGRSLPAHGLLLLLMSEVEVYDALVSLNPNKAMRRTIGNPASITTKKTLYLSLVRSQLVYCSQLWRPYLINHIVQLERIQRRATRFIVNNSQLNNKEKLEALHL